MSPSESIPRIILKFTGSSFAAGCPDEQFVQVQKDKTASSPSVSQFSTDLERLKRLPLPEEVTHEHGDEKPH
jgi:hypothetical protein